MICVTQTRTGSENGNCFAACLASILEIPLYTVTDFMSDGNQFLDEVARFLEPYDRIYIQVEPTDPILNRMFAIGKTFHTIEGVSPRGGLHACVGCNGEIVHDPHPADGTQHGLVTVQTFGLLVSRNVETVGKLKF